MACPEHRRRQEPSLGQRHRRSQVHRTGLVSGFGMVSYGHGLSSSAVILQKVEN
jgi:hypothetical protein